MARSAIFDRLRKNETKTRKASRRAAPELRVAINPTDIFSVTGLTQLLRLRRHSVPREIRAGRLRACRRCGRLWITGESVLQWLSGAENLDRPRG
jgi:hypothetical protein